MPIKTLNAAQLECLSSPARSEVFMQLRSIGQASIGELGRSLGKRPEAIHYHVKALVKAKLAKEAFRRPGIKKPESVYEPIGTNWRLPRMRAGSPVAEMARKTVAAGFRQSARGYLKAAERADREPHVRKRMQVIRMNIRLKPEDIPVLMEMIEAVVKFADEHKSADGERLAWSSILYPPVR